MSTAVNVVEMSYSADEIRERVRAAGVVGAGGAGFPAHVKLQAQVEIFLVNAAECEPMLKVDQQLMWQQAARLVRGVQYAMTATGAREGVIALKEKYRRAIDALTPQLPAGIRLHILPDVYPAGDEVLTIWMATGRHAAAAAERPYLLGMQRLRKRGLPGGDLADAHQPHVKTRAAGAKPALRRAAESGRRNGEISPGAGEAADRQTGTKPLVPGSAAG